MARLSPTPAVLRGLFTRSGNRCAFPGCDQLLINPKNQFIAQVCHIKAALPKGERYDPGQTDDERRAYDNLLLLCYPHHVETNDVVEFTVERLRQIKREHEARFEGQPYAVDERVLRAIATEMESFWDQIEKLNDLEHSMREFAVDIDARGSFFEVLAACNENIGYLLSFFDVFRETEDNGRTNWELHNIGVPNRVNRLRIDLMHLEIKYLEEYLKTHDNEVVARTRLDALKAEFTHIAQHAVVYD